MYVDIPLAPHAQVQLLEQAAWNSRALSSVVWSTPNLPAGWQGCLTCPTSHLEVFGRDWFPQARRDGAAWQRSIDKDRFINGSWAGQPLPARTDRPTYLVTYTPMLRGDEWHRSSALLITITLGDRRPRESYRLWISTCTPATTSPRSSCSTLTSSASTRRR